MPLHKPAQDTTVHHSDTFVHVAFDTPRQVVSSAPLNGGWVQASHIVNLNVPKKQPPGAAGLEPPALTLEKYAAAARWEGTVVGMMTAASMDSFRIVRHACDGVEIAVMATSGISNLRRAGDPADYRIIRETPATTGTINLIVITSARLTRAAMIEAVITATEAKAAALQDMDARSPLSGKTATGTGTDEIAVAAGNGPVTVEYCGKHVLFGEILASLIIRAVTGSIGSRIHPETGCNH